MKSISPRPNLFIIGAKKSGTSYLHTLLGQHPQVFMSNPKEPCFFIDQKQLKTIWPEMWRKGYWRNEKAYLNLFKSAREKPIIGESSADYTNYPILSGIPERIRCFNNKSKLIYVMRDPIERSISHYWMHVHYYGKVISPIKAIEQIPEIMNISYYAMQLNRFLQVFDRQQIQAITYEELIRDPKAILKQIFGWLNIDDSFVPDNLNEAVNKGSSTIRAAKGYGFLFTLRDSSLWNAMAPLFPKAFRRMAANLAVTYYEKSQVSMAELKDYLRKPFLPQVAELEVLLRRDFCLWKTLYPQ